MDSNGNLELKIASPYSLIFTRQSPLNGNQIIKQPYKEMFTFVYLMCLFQIVGKTQEQKNYMKKFSA